MISLKVSHVWGPGLEAQRRKEVAEGAGTCLVMGDLLKCKEPVPTQGAEMNGIWHLG